MTSCCDYQYTFESNRGKTLSNAHTFRAFYRMWGRILLRYIREEGSAFYYVSLKIKEPMTSLFLICNLRQYLHILRQLPNHRAGEVIDGCKHHRVDRSHHQPRPTLRESQQNTGRQNEEQRHHVEIHIEVHIVILMYHIIFDLPVMLYSKEALRASLLQSLSPVMTWDIFFNEAFASLKKSHAVMLIFSNDLSNPRIDFSKFAPGVNAIARFDWINLIASSVFIRRVATRYIARDAAERCIPAMQ